MRRAAQKARAKNYVRFSLNQRLDHQRILGRIVFQIGVLNNDEVARGLLNAAAERRSLAHVIRLKNDADLRMLRLQFGAQTRLCSHGHPAAAGCRRARTQRRKLAQTQPIRGGDRAARVWLA